MNMRSLSQSNRINTHRKWYVSLRLNNRSCLSYDLSEHCDRALKRNRIRNERSELARNSVIPRVFSAIFIVTHFFLCTSIPMP